MNESVESDEVTTIKSFDPWKTMNSQEPNLNNSKIPDQ